jgi:hypothetical protein
MSRSIVKEAKASRAYRCSQYRFESCLGGSWIAVGEVCEVTSLPPGTEYNESGKWATFRTCLTCRDARREEMFRWVRSHYDVPCSMDLPVRFDGKDGRIVGTTGGHLLLAMADGTKAQVNPKWRMEYPVAAEAAQ